MKFRNPDTGEVFNNLQQASDAFCLTYDSFCHGCPIDKASMGGSCLVWVKEHPHEAARLMGYEAVEETVDCTPCRTCAFPYPSIMCVNCGTEYRNYEKKKEDANMDKPRIAQVLGVEVGGWWEYGGLEYSVTEKGLIIDHNNTVHFTGLTGAINQPGQIVHKPRWTQQEVEFAKAIKVLFPCAIAVVKAPSGSVSVSGASLVLSTEYFPSIHPGQSYTLGEIIGGGQ